MNLGAKSHGKASRGRAGLPPRLDFDATQTIIRGPDRPLSQRDRQEAHGPPRDSAVECSFTEHAESALKGEEND